MRSRSLLLVLLLVGTGCEFQFPSGMSSLSVEETLDGRAEIRFCRDGLWFCDATESQILVHHGDASVPLGRAFGNAYLAVIHDVDRDAPFVVTDGSASARIYVPAAFERLEPQGAAMSRSLDELTVRWAPAAQPGLLSAHLEALCHESSHTRSVEIEGDPGELTLSSRNLPRIGDRVCPVSVRLMREVYKDPLTSFAGSSGEVSIRSQHVRELLIDVWP